MSTLPKFSIVFHGLYKDADLPAVLHALKFSDDVIISTWSNNIATFDAEKLEAFGIKLVVSNDPGSILAYKYKKLDRYYNILRIVKGLYSGSLQARHELIIKTRFDVLIDYKKFFDMWTYSKRPSASLNITTVCPDRIFADPFFFHISDWVIGFNKSTFIANCETSQLNESDFVMNSPIKLRNYEWVVRLTAEQILSLIMCGDFEALAFASNFSQSSNSLHLLESTHENVLKKYCNIDRKQVKFKSNKYRQYGTRWTSYDDLLFADSGPIKYNLIDLIMYALSSIKNV